MNKNMTWGTVPLDIDDIDEKNMTWGTVPLDIDDIDE